jgi:alanyl-tRNA synthetase
MHETAVGAGVRRVEAVSGKAAEEIINKEFELIKTIREQFRNPKDLNKAIENIQEENAELKKQLERVEAKQLVKLKNTLLQKAETINGIHFIGEIIEVLNADALKKLCISLKNEMTDYAIILAADIEGKASVAIALDERIAVSKNLDAPKIIKEYITPLIKGGGGGQKTFAIAGGKDATRLSEAIEKIKSLI